MLPVSTWMVRAADLAPSSSFDPPWLSAPVPAYSLLRLQHRNHYYHHHHHYRGGAAKFGLISITYHKYI